MGEGDPDADFALLNDDASCRAPSRHIAAVSSGCCAGQVRSIARRRSRRNSARVLLELLIARVSDGWSIALVGAREVEHRGRQEVANLMHFPWSCLI